MVGVTATEELRAMLDERGVEHYDGTESTLWLKDEHGYRASADELTSGRLSVHIWCGTPEQAIAATLGAGTCEVEVYDDGIDEGMDGDWYSYAPPTWYLSCWHRCEGSERPRYCPRCGRRVVEVDE